jgi:tuftelin-interacting protein 11
MNNDAFRELLHASGEASSSATSQTSKALPSVAVQQMGQWEKHTKGIGKKLLEKFGFKGRLGAKEDGISAAIEVKVRPNTMGLGFGDFKEATQLEVNKRLEAELKGVVYEPEVDKEAKLVSKTKGMGGSDKELTAEQMAASKGWKKGSSGAGKRKQKVLLKDAMELLLESEKAEKKEAAILDMRGPSPKLLRDIKEADTIGSSEDTIAVTTPKLGQELLYNINLIVDLGEIELDAHLRKFKKAVAHVEEVKNQKKAVSERLKSETIKLDKLQAIDTILGRIESKLSASSDDVMPADVINALMILRKEYPIEFGLLGLADLLPNLCRRMVSKHLGAVWKPLMDPSRPVELFKDWFVAASDLDALDSKREPEIGVRQSRSSLTPALVRLAESLLTFNIRRCLQNDWDVKTQPDEAVRLLSELNEGIRGVGLLSSQELSSILSSSVMPRIKKEVESWSPELEKTRPIHWWLHPWIPLLKAELSDVYPDIRRKIGKYLTHWNPTDGTAHAMLAPWRGVFDSTSMNNLILRAVVPKLVSSMRSIPIDPANTTAEHTQLFSAIMTWHDLVPRVHFVSILEGEFFPRWLHILRLWMASESPDFEEVTQWYLGWKSLIPDALESDEVVSGYFHYALDIMQHVLAVVTAGASEGTAISDSISSVPLPSNLIMATDYFEVLQRRQIEVAARKRLEEMRDQDRQRAFQSGSSEYAAFEAKEETIRAATLGGGLSAAESSFSFKEFVESYASRHGIPFVPKPGRMHEGKQVYLFGATPCYLDQAVVFAYTPTGSGHSWEPVSLEGLLASSEN